MGKKSVSFLNLFWKHHIPTLLNKKMIQYFFKLCIRDASLVMDGDGVELFRAAIYNLKLVTKGEWSFYQQV